MLGVGICIVILFNLFFIFGIIRVIVLVVFVEVGIIFIAVVLVFCIFLWLVFKICWLFV